MEQRLRTLTGDEFLGSRDNFRCAAKNSSSLVFGSASVRFSSALAPANFSTNRMRFTFLAMDDFFAI
jgi:hypothetical protein